MAPWLNASRICRPLLLSLCVLVEILPSVLLLWQVKAYRLIRIKVAYMWNFYLTLLIVLSRSLLRHEWINRKVYCQQQKKPFSFSSDMISETKPALTASGLIRAKVKSESSVADFCEVCDMVRANASCEINKRSNLIDLKSQRDLKNLNQFHFRNVKPFR